MLVNSKVVAEHMMCITATLSSGTYSLQGRMPTWADGADVVLGTYGSQSAAQSALSAFLAVAGDPWIAIGSLSNVGNLQDPWIVAVNLANVISYSDATTGIGFEPAVNNNGKPSAGYEPYADAASAEAGLKALLGDVDVF